MLELKNIKKTYKVGDIETKALDGISVSFAKKEFVAILGASGSGKTTALNIIGGLDHYDSGDLIIKGKSTKNFTAYEWDAYRNNSIGFVFQSYNLISHLSIVDNVELGMTLSGVNREQKHKKALEVLGQVGLKDHLHKKPNQLSGGQMQRVAIARALANDPKILLCDEPTGALDSVTSIQILELIKNVAKDRLVIMVTHNPALAEKYADRIIQFEDGKIVSDTNPYIEKEKNADFNLTRTSMSYLTAIRLSFNNLRTKKGRTFLTAFASSIGIIGIAVILSLSSGFQSEIDKFQEDAMAEFPVFISKTTQEINKDELADKSLDFYDRVWGSAEYVDEPNIVITDEASKIVKHTNDFTNEFMDYIAKISPEICGSIGYTRIVRMNLVKKDADGYKYASLLPAGNGNKGGQMMMTSTSGMGLSCYPKSVGGNEDYLKKNYELISGNYPNSPTEVVLIVDTKMQIDKATLQTLGISGNEKNRLEFSDIIGSEYMLISNNDYYEQTGMGSYLPSFDYEKMYNAKNNIPIKVVGILRAAKGTSMSILSTGIAYSDELSQIVIDSAVDSDIVKAQKAVDYNILTLEKITSDKKAQLVAFLGGDEKPFMLMLYPTSFQNKDALIKYIEQYNIGKENDKIIVFTDLAGTISEMTGGIMDGVTIVLIAFSAISLVVSMIMICIITYTSVLERTKEIGVLKALGARKKDITRVFDAETLILGVFSGLLGVIIAWGITFPINIIIEKLSGLAAAAHLRLDYALILVAISTFITIIGGHVPAKIASKKDAVEALRTE